MPIKLCVFDWSGTISDDRLPVYQANRKLCEHYGVTLLPYNEWLRATTMTPREYFASVGVTDNQETLFRIYKQYYIDVINSGTIPTVYPEAKPTLSALSEHNVLAVVSSHPVESLQQEADHFDLRHLFKRLVGESKNKTEDLLTLVHKLGYSTDETVYVGDMIYDIRSAKAASITSIAVTTGYHSKNMLQAEHPDHIIDNLTQLQGIVSSI